MVILRYEYVQLLRREMPILRIHWAGKAHIEKGVRKNKKAYIIKSTLPGDSGPVNIEAWTPDHPDFWGDQAHRATAGQMGVTETELYQAVQDFLKREEQEP